MEQNASMDEEPHLNLFDFFVKNFIGSCAVNRLGENFKSPGNVRVFILL